MERNNGFHYTYSAPTQEERREIMSIRKRYEESEEKEDKLKKLRKLHAKVTTVPQCLAITLGVVGVLLFGFGLTMILEWDIFVWGVVVSVVGFIPVILAHPVYQALIKRNKNKYKDEILRLSDELLNEEQEKY